MVAEGWAPLAEAGAGTAPTDARRQIPERSSRRGRIVPPFDTPREPGPSYTGGPSRRDGPTPGPSPEKGRAAEAGPPLWFARPGSPAGMDPASPYGLALAVHMSSCCDPGMRESVHTAWTKLIPPGVAAPELPW